MSFHVTNDAICDLDEAKIMSYETYSSRAKVFAQCDQLSPDPKTVSLEQSNLTTEQVSMPPAPAGILYIKLAKG